MRNKKLLVLAALLCAALATAGIALATVKNGVVAATSATFDATTVVNHVQKTCTVSGGDTYALSRATYKGAAASSDARLNGSLTIRGVSLVDQTTGVGAFVGTFSVHNGHGHPHALGRIKASLSSGQVSGMVRAHVGAPSGELFAGVNGSFTTSGGFSDASLGTGSSTDSGVVLSRGRCVRAIPLGY
jgi:hypothetical protein